MNTAVSIHRFNSEEYHRLVENNILHEDDRVELIEGRIVDMTPIGSKHAACVNRLNEIFCEKLQKRAIVTIQNPVCLTEYSELEPNIATIKRRPDFYARQLPQNVILKRRYNQKISPEGFPDITLAVSEIVGISF